MDCYQLIRGGNGDPGRTRTCNLLIRSQLLYPVELRNRKVVISENFFKTRHSIMR